MFFGDLWPAIRFVYCAVTGLAVPGLVSIVRALSGRAAVLGLNDIFFAVPGLTILTFAVPGLADLTRAVPGRVAQAEPSLVCDWDAVAGREHRSTIPCRFPVDSDFSSISECRLVSRCFSSYLVGLLLTHVLSSVTSYPFWASSVAISRSDRTWKGSVLIPRSKQVTLSFTFIGLCFFTYAEPGRISLISSLFLKLASLCDMWNFSRTSRAEGR